jgi:uncharacterized protein (TIGR02687 family)
MNMNKISQALSKLFTKHRIVFWYDTKKELCAEFESIALPDVEKIELNNNEFKIKYHILREKPSDKFLIYYEGPPPPDVSNWLLDVYLAHAEFKADQVSLWLSELGLGPEYWDVIQDHLEFYKAANRRLTLKGMLKAEDSPNKVRMKVLAVCAGFNAEARLDDILEVLLDELAYGRDEIILSIKRFNLDDFLWMNIERDYGYTSPEPGVQDFAIELFKSCYAMGLTERAALTPEALVFLKRWKDSRKHYQAFEKLSDQYVGLLNIEEDLQKRSLDDLADLDFFRVIDQKILHELVKQLSNRTISAGDCAQIIWQRRTTHWYSEFKHIYEAVYFASQFIHELDRIDITIQSFSEGIDKYSQNWYRLDQMYRQFIFHGRASRQASPLETLNHQIENLYSNKFLLKINDAWQQMVDASQCWEADRSNSQQDFYDRYVAGYPRNQKKVVVVISDALRYEIGMELLELIKREDRYTAEIDAAVTTLPSYTQLGMASLLPHEIITVQADSRVLVDGQSSQGLENRAKILDQAFPGNASALRAETLLAMTKEESRLLFKDNQVLYVYHNQIDAVGDKRDSENRVFEVVDETFKELIDILKKLANANFTNMIITADHGFIYQHRAIDESEYAGIDVSGDQITYRHRRFVLGKGLQTSPSIKIFHSSEVGLGGDVEIAIPKSINRLRLKGAGSRYVHGGASLQEVVIPIIKINKKRESDISKVEIEVIRSPSSVISTGQLAVAFYQVQPVSSKLQGRHLRAGIYAKDGNLISDTHDLIFDLTAENAREREVAVRFVLSRSADQYNEQEVLLRLEELVADTTHYREYKSVRYILRRSFTSDFDF